LPVLSNDQGHGHRFRLGCFRDSGRWGYQVVSIAAFLTAMAGPLATRVLVSIGVGVVSYVGLDMAVTAQLDAARQVWGQQNSGVLTYLAMAGVNKALSILAAGVMARLAIVAVKRVGVIS
jgi:hypothetical protein